MDWTILILLVSSEVFAFNNSIQINNNINDIYEDQLSRRIIGGVLAEPGDISGIVSLQRADKRGHACGSTWIDKLHILTAAQCVVNADGFAINAENFTAMGDDISITDNSVSKSRQLRNISHVFSHPDYNVDLMINDIAVLRLVNEFKSTNTFQVMPMATTLPPPDTECTIAGWGSTYKGGDLSPKLMKVDIFIVDKTICNGKDIFDGYLGESVFCAGVMEGGKDACQGDSGGPLICKSLLTGIPSFGQGCAVPGYPAAFVDVAYFRNWIADMIQFKDNGQELPKHMSRNLNNGAVLGISASSYLLISLSTMICIS